jgi:hypothetical protein
MNETVSEERGQGMRHMQRKNRDPFDFYITPAWGTEALLSKETFAGRVLEPCAGNGAISRVFEANGYDVESSDLRRTEDVYGTPGLDFLRREERIDNIVTNPPFNQAEAMVRHSLKLARHKVAFLLKLTFLESQERYSFFKSTPLRMVYVFSSRLGMKAGNFEGNDAKMIPFAWYVWEHGHSGPATIDWLLAPTVKEQSLMFELAEVA